MTLLHLLIIIVSIFWIIFTIICIKDGMNDYGKIDSDLKFINFFINFILVASAIAYLCTEINWNYKLIK